MKCNWRVAISDVEAYDAPLRAVLNAITLNDTQCLSHFMRDAMLQLGVKPRMCLKICNPWHPTNTEITTFDSLTNSRTLAN
jgi:hypothetical protein